MSAIFPTTPPKVNIHLLPKKAEMISYNISDVLSISAWMPDKFEKIDQKTQSSNDDFYYNYCDGCSRNSYYFIEDYMDEDGDIDWDNPDLLDHCNVYDDGYHGQFCPLGYKKIPNQTSFYVSDMVFEIKLSYLGSNPRFEVKSDSVYLQKFKLDEDVNQTKKFIASDILMASNVFGSEDYPEGVCWGYNYQPTNIREMVSQYFSTPFNNDLTTLSTFEDNCNNIRSSRYFSEENLRSKDEKYFNGQTDALMLIDAEENIPAFFNMIMAGFSPLPEAPHIMMIPIYECEINKGGNLYRGFKTIEDSVGKSWFIVKDDNYENVGLLVGQI